MRIIDADLLKGVINKFVAEKCIGEFADGARCVINLVNQAPTVCNDNYSMGYQDGVRKVLSERPQGEIIKELWNCRDELCLKCERYKEAWNGACKDCRYNFENMRRWKEDSDEVADDKHL